MAELDHKLAELLKDQSFVRWTTGKASSKERKRWEAWEQQDYSHALLKEQARQIYDLPMAPAEEMDYEKELALLNMRIDNYEAFQKSGRRRQNRYKYYWVAAAIVTLVISVLAVMRFVVQDSGSQYAKPVFSTLKVGYGETGSLKISDGSIIRLNSNSSLRYNKSEFNTQNVDVWLDGEAYFSIVNKDDEHERVFTVHTSDGKIQVLGTKFNVNTAVKNTNVVLEKGRVALFLQDSFQNVKAKTVITPGQKATLNPQLDTIPTQNVNPSLYTAWLEGNLKFDQSSLREIIQTIETTYGASIKVPDTSLLDKKISGSLQNPDLKTLVRGLELALDLDFKQQSENEYLVTRQQ